MVFCCMDGPSYGHVLCGWLSGLLGASWYPWLYVFVMVSVGHISEVGFWV